MKKILMDFLLMVSCLILLSMTGCASYTKNLSPEDELHYDASYDFSDKNFEPRSIFHCYFYMIATILELEIWDKCCNTC